MDLNRVAQVIGLILKNPTDLLSLQIQNHVYGCFVVLEDIASTDNTVIGTKINYQDCTFDYDLDFTKIGVQYGFLPDMALILPDITEHIAQYKAAFLGIFNYISGAKNIALVDAIEEKLFLILTALVPDTMSFFQNATSTGELDENFSKLAETIIRDANTAFNTLTVTTAATVEEPKAAVAEEPKAVVEDTVLTSSILPPPPIPATYPKSILKIRIDKPMRRTRKTRIRNITPIQRRKRLAYTRKRNKN